MIVANESLPTPEEEQYAGREAVCQAVAEFVAWDYDEFGGKKQGRSYVASITGAVKSDRIDELNEFEVFLLWDAVGCSGLLCEEDRPGVDTIRGIYGMAHSLWTEDVHHKEVRKKLCDEINGLERELQDERIERFEAELKAEQIANEMKQAIASQEAAAWAAKQAQADGRYADTVVGRARKKAAKILADAKSKAAITRAMAQADAAARLELRPADGVDAGGFPPPPDAFVALPMAMCLWRERSGIYFVVRDGALAYVGKSESLMRRWRNHHIIKPADMIGVVEMPEDQIGLAETHYIRSLRPPLNGEIRAMNRRKAMAEGE